ncbi:MAG: hypothetical protein ACUVRD_08590 [Bacteroidia bacterium]
MKYCFVHCGLHCDIRHLSKSYTLRSPHPGILNVYHTQKVTGENLLPSIEKILNRILFMILILLILGIVI